MRPSLLGLTFSYCPLEMHFYNPGLKLHLHSPFLDPFQAVVQPTCTLPSDLKVWSSPVTFTQKFTMLCLHTGAILRLMKLGLGPQHSLTTLFELWSTTSGKFCISFVPS